MRNYLKKKLNVPDNWDKYDYQTQRYSFEDVEEILQQYKDEQLKSDDSIMEDSVCTVNDSRDDALQWAKLFEKAPDMLKVLKDLRDGDYPSINGALWQSINDSIDGLA